MAKTKLVWKIERRIGKGLWETFKDGYKTHAEAIGEKWRLINETGEQFRTAAYEGSK